MKKFYVISYDIVEDTRRTKIANELKNYGTRVQYSVFECIISQEQLKTLAKSLKQIINQKQDSIRIYEIGECCLKKIQTYGQGKITEEKEVIVV